jgi:YhcH/YjgK/YiaL family protein
MIYDTLSNLGRYTCIPHAKEISDFFAANDIALLADGSHPINGDDVVFKKSRYCPKAITNTRFESHRHFADLHVVISGSEIIRTVFMADAGPAVPYAENDDVEFFTGDRNISGMVLAPGMFLWLFPGEPHRPGCVCEGYDGEVVKGVVKVRMGEGDSKIQNSLRCAEMDQNRSEQDLVIPQNG